MHTNRSLDAHIQCLSASMQILQYCADLWEYKCESAIFSVELDRLIGSTHNRGQL